MRLLSSGLLKPITASGCRHGSHALMRRTSNDSDPVLRSENVIERVAPARSSLEPLGHGPVSLHHTFRVIDSTVHLLLLTV
ncbi:hypothetical protein KC19_9G153000 [Ceratodon purpureus]|uniref:Uncharacterized protein n=1 Tax=Ceratodon purpureus TaxID=3225 RepID=A0A8T0GS75_CERPU|nr:hypothetical protein KC19_9G153000 [Ceratodon purpureus]